MEKKFCNICWEKMTKAFIWYYCDYCKYGKRTERKDWYDKASKTIADKVTGRISNWVFEIKGEKESDNKLSYELDRYFIEAMAKRMEQNKGKYPPYNRQKPMDIESLKQALLRHTIEVMKWNHTDITDYDHLQSISLNAMFIYYQLKNNDLRKQ